MIILQLFLILVLLAIALQDFKSMTVTWFFFPLIFIFNAIISIMSNGINQSGLYFTLNLLFILLLVGIIALYVFIKYKKIKILYNLLGLGDVLFFLALAPAFATFNFLFFNFFTFFLALIIYGLTQAIIKSKKKIPLAGFQAACFIVLTGFDYFSVSFDRYNDDFILLSYLSMKL